MCLLPCRARLLTTGETDDRFGDQQLATGYCNKLKTWTQNDGESSQEFATAIEQLAYHAYPVRLRTT
jgi:hypothetical protein